MSANRNSVEWMCVSSVGCGSLLRSHTYAYDGWNLILEQIAHAGGATDVIEYFWGYDLSGSERGAGGVGGLVALSINGDFYFPCYDNNGNIIAYVDESGSIAAQFAYDAFGNLLTADNSELATLLSLRFSTKYLDPETGLYYYGFRYYDPNLGRWLTRDPLEEQGGLNLYGFCGNDAVNKVDKLGTFWIAPVGDSPSANWVDSSKKAINDLYAGVFIVFDKKDLLKMPTGGTIVHGKRVTINLTDGNGNLIENKSEVVTKRISIDSNGFGRHGVPDSNGMVYSPNQPSTSETLGKINPLYFSLLSKHIGKCVQGSITIRANWYMYSTHLVDYMALDADKLSGSDDHSERHGSMGSIPGWPQNNNKFVAAGSYYVTIELSCKSPVISVMPYANPLWRKDSSGLQRDERFDGEWTTSWGY